MATYLRLRPQGSLTRTFAHRAIKIFGSLHAASWQPIAGASLVVLKPDASVLGASEEELRAFALDRLTRRLKLIGVPIDTL